jgi:Heavy metal binding domain
MKKENPKNNKVFTCPMHPKVETTKMGSCPLCGMALEVAGKSTITHIVPLTETRDGNILPLFIILGLIVLVAFIATINNPFRYFDWHSFMNNLMAGYFIVFAGFKLLDVHGFSQGFAMYDLLAKRLPVYGFIYPFVELILGLTLLTGSHLLLAYTASLIIMTFSGIGVAIKLYKKEQFQCACLGTFLKVPLTTVSLAEDLGMGAMSLFMLIFYFGILKLPLTLPNLFSF